MDKIKTKTVLEMKSVPTAPWGLANRDTAKSPLALPVVVKPPSDGSSVGISKVSNESEWLKALDVAFACQQNKSLPVLVEEFIPGREFTVAVVDGETWPVIEIVASNGWYGYDEKYNSQETMYPFLEDEKLSGKLQALALDAYNALGCPQSGSCLTGTAAAQFFTG